MHEHRAGWGDRIDSRRSERRSRANTCWLKATKPYTNVATIKGGGEEKPSNKVEVKVEERKEFTIHKEQRIQGEASYTTDETVVAGRENGRIS